MTAYATRADFFRYTPRGVVAEEPCAVAAIDTANDLLTVNAHWLYEDAPIQFVPFDEVNGVLPAPLSESATYYAAPVADSDSTFKVRLAAGGAVVDLTDEGTGAFAVKASINQIIDQLLEDNSRWVDDRLIGHSVPLTAPYPRVVVAAVCKVTARDLFQIFGSNVETIFEMARLAVSDLDRWASGKTIRGENKPPSANTAKNWGTSRRGWALPDGRVL